ncbi:hypothetical protein [Vibrio agarivorans]|uniref:Uncharacterized protein n=1 Tax=Vibrio agarivorans TaxID=153622 RepID=A0ABT7Y7I6_9VIBR|nr:hypothetical protein [Vibrio agarivorans]MDN2484018.1 hypothetical protein [Vibrio agarivorans]
MKEKTVESYRQYLTEKGELDSYLKGAINATKETWFDHIKCALRETGNKSDSSDVRAIILNGKYQELVSKYRSLSDFDLDVLSSLERLTGYDNEYLLSIFSGVFLDEAVTVKSDGKIETINVVGM